MVIVITSIVIVWLLNMVLFYNMNDDFVKLVKFKLVCEANYKFYINNVGKTGEHKKNINMTKGYCNCKVITF